MSVVLCLRGPNKKIGGIEAIDGIKIINGIKIIDGATAVKRTRKIIINFLIFN